MPKKVKRKKVKPSVKKKKVALRVKKTAVKKPGRKALKKTVSGAAAKAKVKAKAKARAKAPAAPSPVAGLEQVGEITHYFPHVNAGVIKLTRPVSKGQDIYIKGHTTDFKQKIESLQIDRAPVEQAGPGDEIGILVPQRVRAGDKVYRV